MAERVVQKYGCGRLRPDPGRAHGRPQAHGAGNGAWNLQGGPDFRGARLVLDGREITGDVEVHFHTADCGRTRTPPTAPMTT